MPSDAPGSRAAGFPPPSVRAPRGRVRGTLAGRISLLTTAVALLMAAIVGAVIVSQVRAQATAEARSSLARAADSVAGTIERTGSLQSGKARLAAVRAGGVDIERVFPGALLPGILAAADLVVLEQDGRFSAERQSADGRVFVEARTLSDGSVLVVTQKDDVTAGSTARSITTLALALGLGVVLAAAAGVVLARRLARPLQVAAGAASRMAHGQRDVTVTPEGPKEVAEVAESLNDLNEALSVSEARQREFLLSVSHELRTPLTSLQGYSEAMADGVVPHEEISETAKLMVGESRRLDRLVTDLLDLARMGAREVRIDVVEVDVAELLSEAAHVWGDLCAAEGVVFTSQLPSGPATAHTDAVRVRQIIDNLMGNALRMTPSGQAIDLTAKVDQSTFTLVVSDGGPGLTDDDLAVAFEPAELYSRYQGVRKVGSGVGLALVGRLAQRMGGSAQAGRGESGGAVFTITLARNLPEPSDSRPAQGPDGAKAPA